MAAVKGSRMSHTYYPKHEPWQPTPRWHFVRYYLGWTLRRWVFDGPWQDHGFWEYGRPRKVVRQILKERFDVR